MFLVADITKYITERHLCLSLIKVHKASDTFNFPLLLTASAFSKIIVISRL